MSIVNGFGGVAEDPLEASACLVPRLDCLPCISLVLGCALERLLGIFEGFAGGLECGLGLFVG